MQAESTGTGHPLVTGSVGDVETVQAVLARLQPQCPRCRHVEIWPLTWADAVIWFLCSRCFKLWHVDVPVPAASATPNPAQDLPAA